MEPEILSDSVPITGWRRTFAALSERNFRIFFSGQFVSQMGTWMRSSALGWIALHRTGSEFWLGMVSVATALPMLILSPWAGSLADRYPRLQIFRSTTLLAMLASGALALLLFLDKLPTAMIYVLAMIWGTATAFEMPARQSMVVDLAGRKNLVNAIALNSASVNANRVVGPALGGLLLAAVGGAWCFLTDAISYLVVFGSTFWIEMPPRAKARHKGGAWLHLKEGARYVWSHRSLRPAMLMLLSMGVFGWAFFSQMAAVAKLGLGLGPKGYGFLLAASGLGAVISALTVATRGGRGHLRAQMSFGVTAFAISLSLATLPKNPWLAALGFMGAGFGLVLFFASCNSYVQTRTQDAYRGRVMGLYALVFGGGVPLGSLWMAVAAEHLGVMVALRISAVMALLAASAASRFGGVTRIRRRRHA